MMTLSALFLLAGCGGERAAAGRILLEVDGARRFVALPAEAQTVSDALLAAGVTLDEADRVEPPSFTLLQPELPVRVVRVREREIQQEQSLPFGREVRRDASLPQGEVRVVQLGQNGRELLTFRLTLEDGEEVAREEVGRETLQPPAPEVLVVGTRGSGEPVTFQGTLVYLEQGNAWVMRGDSLQKRALTRTGDLDGHVFALSPDGRWLLFTREPLGGASGQGGPLNTLWLVDTRIANEEPRSLQLDSVLWADWEPCPLPDAGCPLQVAYSTAERVPTPPGWRAHNDLWRIGMNVEGVRGEPVPVLAARSAPYGWWGRSWVWSPDGTQIAWADATRVGVVELATRRERLLAEFVPYETNEAWVWTPQLAWSLNARSLVATLHRASSSAPGGAPERSERFDLWRLPLSGDEAESLAESVGPFAMPTWLGPTTLFFAQAEDPGRSVASRYHLMARVTTLEPRRLFPPVGQPGVDVPWSAWNPLDGALVAVWQGDLWLVPLDEALPPRALTVEGGASRPEWGP